MLTEDAEAANVSSTDNPKAEDDAPLLSDFADDATPVTTSASDLTDINDDEPSRTSQADSVDRGEDLPKLHEGDLPTSHSGSDVDFGSSSDSRSDDEASA
jgi:hypothetical protein